LEYSVDSPLDLMLIMCISVLCVLLYAQIEGEFSLYLVGPLVPLKYILCSPTHWKRRMDGSFGFSGCFTIILGGLGLYKPSAPGLVSDALILSETRFE
jgi:hypothetical protein